MIFDGTNVFVLLPPSIRGQVEGIAGNFDGDPQNDFVLPDGTDVSNNPDKFNLIGNSWFEDDPDNPE